MRDDSLKSIVRGADPADEEDIFLRAALVAALCETYADKDAAGETSTADIAIEDRDDDAVEDGAPNGSSIPIPFPRYRPAPARLHYGWAIAASLLAVVTFGGGVMWGGKAPSERADLLDEVAGYHEVYSRETAHLVEVPASQSDQLTAWLGERLDRELNVPDLADSGLKFAGGRMLVINDHPVAELMYTRAEGLPIAICISRIDGKPWAMSVEQHGDLRIASWAKDAFAYVVVGELDDAAVKDLAWRVKTQI